LGFSIVGENLNIGGGKAKVIERWIIFDFMEWSFGSFFQESNQALLQILPYIDAQVRRIDAEKVQLRKAKA
jgi:hypothetical protein